MSAIESSAAHEFGAARTLTRAAFETLRISVPTVFDALLGRLTREACDRRLRAWSRRLLDEVQATVELSGDLGAVERGQSYIVMSNHQSHYDIPVLYRALDLSLRMVAKAELFKIPLWSRAMRAAGFIAIERGEPRQAYRALEAARQQIAQSGVSIWIAPEGTRSHDGELGPFKKGGFWLARATGLPILPVTIVGSRGIHRPGASRIGVGQSVRVIIGSPVPVPRRGAMPDLMDRVRAAIAEPLTTARA